MTTPAVAKPGAGVTLVNGTPWRNDLKAAIAEAKSQNKPILLLSMFGRIDEKMPCANARTLRATLFQTSEFKQLVGKDVIPAWEMVRPVPRVTIDFGDGKKIERTVRGNAVMYLLNSDGQVIDAFPGVYTAGDFVPAVRATLAALAKADAAQVAAFHQSAATVAMETRRRNTTLGKSVVESPTLFAIGASPIAGASPTVRPRDAKHAAFLTAAAQLADLSLTPMPPADAVRLATNNPAATPKDPGIAERIIASDSRRNLEAVRPVVHLWLASEPKLLTPAEARDIVLETILKIPYKDPYFGLEDVLLPGTPAAKK